MDPESKNWDLGVLTEDQMSPLIRTQAKKLTVGQVSEVFSGPTAHFILKLVDVKSSESDRLEKMKEEIRAQLAASEYQHQISLWLERHRQTTVIHLAGQPSIAGVPSVK